MARPPDGPVHVTLVLETDEEARDVEEATARLRRELLSLDVDSVERAPGGAAPEGTRAVDLASIATLIVTVAQGAAALAPLVTAVQAWLAARSSGTVKLEIDGDKIEIPARMTPVQQRAVDAWLARHPNR
jgi:hypothetical protein